MKLSGLASKTYAVAIAVNATPNPSTNPTRAPPPADHWPTHEITFAITSAITRFATSAVTYIHGSGCALLASICSGVIPSPAVYGPLSAVNQPACANQSTIAATTTANGFTLFIRAPLIQQHSIGAPLSLGNQNSRLNVCNFPLSQGTFFRSQVSIFLMPWPKLAFR